MLLISPRDITHLLVSEVSRMANHSIAEVEEFRIHKSTVFFIANISEIIKTESFISWKISTKFLFL
jgi:hypothetical protein